MPLVLNEDQRLLQESAKGFLQQHAPVSALRALRDSLDETGFSRQLWADMAEMGYAGIIIPEAYDGLDFGYVGLGVVLEEMGKTLAVSPILSTVLLSATALIQAGTDQQKTDYLSPIARGEKIVAFALEEGAHHRPNNTGLGADAITQAGNGNQAAGFCLQGSKTFVLDGHIADAFIVVARTHGEPGSDGGLSLFIVDADSDGVTLTRNAMMDSRNMATVNFSNVFVPEAALLGGLGQGTVLLDKVLDIAQVGLSAELLGIARQVFTMTLDYLKQRKQFGVTIGSFQALQHRMAQLFCELELCQSLVLKALQAIDNEDASLPVLASLSKAKLCETVQLATNEAIQMHGGIGMTDELDVGFYIKRARVAQQTFGGYHYHLDRYAQLKGF